MKENYLNLIFTSLPATCMKLIKIRNSTLSMSFGKSFWSHLLNNRINSQPSSPGMGLTMLSHKSPWTFHIGLIVPVLVLNVKSHFVYVCLDSGIDRVINAQYLADQTGQHPKDMMTRGQTSQGIITTNVKWDLPQDQFLIELSSHLSDVAGGDGTFWHVIQDDTWNSQRVTRMKNYRLGKRERKSIEHSTLSSIQISITTTLHKQRHMWRSNSQWSDWDEELQARKKRVEVDRT